MSVLTTDPAEPRWRGLKQFVALLLSVGACFVAAGLGAAATSANVSGWYQTIAKPGFTPPDWIFGPVWTTLFLMMGVAAWLVWRTAAGPRGKLALALFATQLALNVLWSVLFFGLKSPGLAALEIMALWVAIAGTIAAFWPISRWAAALLMPYLAWSSFAAVLNVAIWNLNR